METILVVDEESESLKSLTETLAAEGFSVCGADSLERALASVVTQPPDLILADVRTPHMNGFELCRRLKAQEASASIPLIFVSTSMNAADRREGLALGAADFISESSPSEELLTRIRTHLKLSHLQRGVKTQVAHRPADLHAAMVELQQEIGRPAPAEDALTESQNRFRSMADNASIIIWVTGPDKMCTFLNKKWLDFTGRTLEQELGFGWAQGVHADDLDRCVSTYFSAFEARREFRMEYRLRRNDGEYRWILDEGFPCVYPGGSFGGYIGYCIDVTDGRRAQQEEIGRDRVGSLLAVAGSIAHDFTNLMGTILATAELAEAEIAEGSVPREEIQTIKNVAMRAVDIARELMVYDGRDKGNIDLLNLSQLVEEIMDILKAAISKRCTLKSDLPKNLPRIWGNPTHLRQVVMNLIINASEALSGEDGTVQVKISPKTTSQHANFKDTGMAAGGDYLSLEVSDTGCGMTDEQRTRMFDPFFTTKGRGSGLGLALVQRIVHSHGGVITVNTAPSEGTTFQVLLPCAESIRQSLLFASAT